MIPHGMSPNSETVTCPNCGRNLVVPAQQLGQKMECPRCHQNFIAGIGNAINPSLGIQSELSSPADELERRTFPRFEDDCRRERPLDLVPRMDTNVPDSRAETIVTRGMLALVLCWVPIFSHFLAIRTLMMAREDLRYMNVLLRYDSPFARMQIRAGQLASVAALVLSTLALAFLLTRL